VNYGKNGRWSVFEPGIGGRGRQQARANGFARQDIRVVGEALGMTEAGAMSIAHTDFEVDLIRELKSIGAGEDDAEDYIQGLRREHYFLYIGDAIFTASRRTVG
jgi:hypothetical protein